MLILGKDKTYARSLVFAAGNKIGSIGVNLQVRHDVSMCMFVA